MALPAKAEPSATALSDTCAAALRDAGVAVQDSAQFAERDACSIEEPVAVEAVETRMGRVALPERPVLDCRFAAMFGTWVGEVVSPVAAALAESPVAALTSGPGYQCRHRSSGTRPSEHATGNAIDIVALRLRDGRSIAIERLPQAAGAQGVLLDAISTSACGYFTTVLGPGSDPAHADHLHLDLAKREIAEYRICMPR